MATKQELLLESLLTFKQLKLIGVNVFFVFLKKISTLTNKKAKTRKNHKYNNFKFFQIMK